MRVWDKGWALPPVRFPLLKREARLRHAAHELLPNRINQPPGAPAAPAPR